MDNIKLDFEQARARHLLFKSRLRSILYGIEIDEAPVLSHFECNVGKWIYGHALKTYGHIPEMQELEKVHADIHTDPNFKSNTALKDAMGYIMGMGFIFKAKPEAFASSSCANKMVQ